ncbi:MAG: protein tyrosine phosphatase [Bacteroidetes bacterium MED-G20]|nr:MAG: protein tyrosine phosphatase [Bacteroidetes bacterium MED-G20]
MEIYNILVICTGNSCRSQIAEGYLKFFKNNLNISANIYSAGVRAEGVNKRAIEIMSKDNIDISNHSSNTIDEYLNKEITHVITVCDHANESCPVFLKKTHFTHHNFKDPSKVNGGELEIEEAFIKCRNEIKTFSERYLKKHF